MKFCKKKLIFPWKWSCSHFAIESPLWLPREFQLTFAPLSFIVSVAEYTQRYVTSSNYGHLNMISVRRQMLTLWYQFCSAIFLLHNSYGAQQQGGKVGFLWCAELNRSKILLTHAWSLISDHHARLDMERQFSLHILVVASAASAARDQRYTWLVFA